MSTDASGFLPWGVCFWYGAPMADRNPRLPGSKDYRSSGATARGGVLNRPTPQRTWQVGTIYDYTPQTQLYVVSLGKAGIIPNVARMVSDPGEVGILPRGTEVVVNFEIEGRPLIQGVLKSSATSAIEVNPARISEVRGVGGEDGVYDQKNPTASAHAPNDPVDLIADDWVRKSKHNNFIGVLSGGTNVVSSGPLAQIRTHGVNSMVEVLANVYRHISALGNLEIVNDGGKTSLIWRAGADQLTENGANAENWTIRLDAGATGDLFRLQVTTPHNNTLCELHMSADGRLSLTGVAGVDISSGARGTAREDVAENKEVSVLGAMTTTVGGPVSNTLNASRDTVVALDESISTGNNLKETVGNDRMAHVSNHMKTVVEGGGSAQSPGNLAILWDAVNGGIESVTGNPRSGATPTPKQAQNFVNYAGDFNFSMPPSAKFNVIGVGADSVLLGADGSAVSTDKGHTFSATAVHHVAMFEELRDMIETLLEWCDQHQHLTAMGPTGPAMGAATGPASLKVKPKIPAVRSTRVCVGA